MAETAFEKKVMDRLGDIDKKIDRKFNKIDLEFVGINTKVDDMKDDVRTHEKILNGDSDNWKDEGVLGAVRDITKTVKLIGIIIVTSNGLLALYLNYRLTIGGP